MIQTFTFVDELTQRNIESFFARSTDPENPSVDLLILIMRSSIARVFAIA
ncbi:MAG: hypothetical protein R2877_04245 [Bdellovibrionota bacterium]